MLNSTIKRKLCQNGKPVCLLSFIKKSLNTLLWQLD